MRNKVVGNVSVALITCSLAVITGVAMVGFIEGVKLAEQRRHDAVKIIVRERKKS